MTLADAREKAAERKTIFARFQLVNYCLLQLRSIDCAFLFSSDSYFFFHREERTSIHAREGGTVCINSMMGGVSVRLHHAFFLFPCYRVLSTSYLLLRTYHYFTNKPNCVGIIAISDGSLLMQEGSSPKKRREPKHSEKHRARPARSSRRLQLQKNDEC